MSNFEPITIIQFDEYPEADTMETRRALKNRYRLEGAFWTVIITIIVFMFLGNQIINYFYR